jgi:hypothetical protein
MDYFIFQLESLAEKVSKLLATHPDIARLNTGRTTKALDSLSNSLRLALTPAHQPTNNPTHTKPPSTKTYAAATATLAKKPNTLDHKHTQPGKTRPPQPPRPAESRRLIVDFCGILTPKDPAPLQIRDELNQALAKRGLHNIKVSAAKRTNLKNAVLSFTPPHAVHTLLRPDIREDLLEDLKALFGLQAEDRIDIYPDDKWHRVVINKIPIKGPGLPAVSFQESLARIESDWRTYNPVGSETRSTAFQHMRLLASPDAQVLDALETISICLAFHDAKHARRLLREGAFINGAHCRTSIYISRRR